MKRFAHVLIALLLICNSLACIAEVAPEAEAGTETDALEFIPGERLDIFEQDGINVYLTGEVVDEGLQFLRMEAIIENDSDKNIRVCYNGVANGWSVNNSVMGGSKATVNAGSKAKSYIWLLYDDLDIASYNDLETLSLTFTVEDSDDNSALFTLGPISIALGELEKEITYYEDCPILPTPESYIDVRQSSSGRRSVNNQVVSISYSYTLKNENEDAQDVYNAYINALQDDGFTVEETADEYVVSDGGTHIATITFDAGTMNIEIVPGNEDMVSRADAASSETTDAQTASMLALGETVTTNDYEFTLENVELTYELLPSNTSGFYESYPAESGKVYLHAEGSLKNLMKRDIRIGELFTVIAIYGDGYGYSGFVVVNDGDNQFSHWSNDVAAVPLETCHVHALIELPEEASTSDENLLLVMKLSDGRDYQYNYRVKGESGAASAEETASSREYNDRDTVRSVQTALNEAGYDCGTPDGIAGKNTKAAISAFQQDNGLSETGTVTHELLLALGIVDE